MIPICGGLFAVSGVLLLVLRRWPRLDDLFPVRGRWLRLLLGAVLLATGLVLTVDFQVRVIGSADAAIRLWTAPVFLLGILPFLAVPVLLLVLLIVIVVAGWNDRPRRGKADS